jgi:tRNA threonylcarbamoyladenosine biosynthesis protein TsaE
MYKFISNSPKDTEKLGYKLGKALKSGDILCLLGDLGAGKTALTKAIAKGLGIDDYVTSPTFTIINEYNGRLPLYHFDVYRLMSIDELYDLGYEEYFYSNGITIIEWADKIEEILPEDTINIHINRTLNQNEREFIFTGKGKRFNQIIKELNEN